MRKLNVLMALLLLGVTLTAAQECLTDSYTLTYSAVGILQVQIDSDIDISAVNIVSTGQTDDFSFTVTTSSATAYIAEDIVSSALAADDATIYEVGISSGGYKCPAISYGDSDTDIAEGDYNIDDVITVTCDGTWKTIPAAGGAPLGTVTSTCTYALEGIYWTHQNDCDVLASTFISTWDTSNVYDFANEGDNWNGEDLYFGSSPRGQVLLPLTSDGTYNFVVRWGDGTSDTVTAWDSADAGHEYPDDGIYTIQIDGIISGWRFYYSDQDRGDSRKIFEISQWGDLDFGTSATHAFAICRSLYVTAVDAPGFASVTSMRSMFIWSDLGITDLNAWDTSSVTNFRETFRDIRNSNFELSVGDWDTSSATDMYAMFYYCNHWTNGNLESWDTSKLSNTDNMFGITTKLNLEVSSWDTSSVTKMRYMFQRNNYMNSDIGGWDTSSNTDFSGMFSSSYAFAHDLKSWDVSNGKYFSSMFNAHSGTSFDLTDWDVREATSCTSFDSNNPECAPWFPVEKNCVICHCTPVITNITGCAANIDGGTFGCIPGDLITIEGDKFGFELEILIDDEPCVLFENATLDNILDDDTYVCVVPVGTGALVGVKANIGSCHGENQFMLGYVAPEVYLLEHIDCETGLDGGLEECPRTGGGTLTITGVNFGTSAAVFVGTEFCEHVVHDASDPTSIITCDLPEGSTLNSAVLVIAAGGSVSLAGLATLGFVQCEMGYFQDNTEITCGDCPVGKFTDHPGQFSCTLCPAGSINDAIQRSSCEDCPSGEFQSALGQTVCVDCLVGRFSNDDTNKFECTMCEPGTVQPLAGQQMCNDCIPGEGQSLEGQTLCQDCALGKYTDVAGIADCFECGSGLTGSSSGQSVCDDCAPGKFKDHVGTDACEDCGVGSFTNDNTIMSSCVPCEAGSYQDVEGQPACNLCPAGSYLVNIGSNSSSDCIECEAGTINTADGSVVCGECQSVTSFQADPGMAVCQQCPFNSISAANHTSCECDFGYYGINFGDWDSFEALDLETHAAYVREFTNANPAPDFDASEYLGFWCVECPEGANCFQTGTTVDNVEPEEGFFIGVGSDATTFLTCLNENACAADGCAEGYTGESCTECSQGLVLDDSFECVECPALVVTLVLLLVGFIVFVLVLVIKNHDVKNGGYTKKDVFAKIIISSFQVNGLALFYAFNWDSYMQTYLWILNQLTSLGTSFFNIQCMGDTTKSSFVQDSIIWLFFPIMISFAILVITFLNGVRTRTGDEKLNMVVAKRILKEGLDTVKSTSGLALFFIQPNLVRQASLVFSCVRLGAGPADVYLTEDLTLQCWTSAHWVYIFFLGLPMLLLYIVGLPFVLHSTLRKSLDKVTLIISDQQFSLRASHDRNSEVLTHQTEEQRKQAQLEQASKTFYTNYAFLFLGYRLETYNWEVFILLRKSLIAIIAVAFVSDPRSQGLFGLVTMINFLVLHAAMRPFEKSWLNKFEFVSLLTSVATFFFGMLTMDAGLHGNVIQSASFFALAANFVYILQIFWYGHRLYKGGKDMDELAKSTEERDDEAKEKSTDDIELEEKTAADNFENDPEEWTTKVDKKSGRTYYNNRKAGKKVWNKPECLA